MPDEFAARVSSLAVIVAALSTLGAVIYLSVRGQPVNEYLAGLAGLTIGALLPSPLTSQHTAPQGIEQGPDRAPGGTDLARGAAPRHP